MEIDKMNNLNPLPSRKSDYKNCDYNSVSDLTIEARIEGLLELKKQMTPEEFSKTISELLVKYPTYLRCIPDIEKLIDIDLKK